MCAWGIADRGSTKRPLARPEWFIPSMDNAVNGTSAFQAWYRANRGETLLSGCWPTIVVRLNLLVMDVGDSLCGRLMRLVRRDRFSHAKVPS